jgi:hypothetical protein
MAFQVNFELRRQHDSLESGITIEAIQRHGEATINCAAKIDTGAQVCLFERDIGEFLGIEIERGLPIELASLTGMLPAYGHRIILETLGLAFETFAYFPESREMRPSILGRYGCFSWLG